MFLNNYADHDTLYLISNAIYKVKKSLSNDFGIIGNWFYKKFMVPNAKNSHYICF